MSDPESDSAPKIILVMGIAGAGKTSFINHLVPQDLKINDTLSVQETSFEEYCIQFAGKDLILVDTPSANTGRNVFKKAAQWLSDRCHRKQLADGVIILYPINLPRLSESCMSYSSLRFGLMEVLDIGVESGSDFNRVVFTTTMWDESSTSPETVIEYLQTEENLRREWLPLIKRGADLRIGTNTVEFAQMVIYDLLKVNRPDISFMRSALVIAVIGRSHSGKSSFIGRLKGTVSPLHDGLLETEIFASLIEVNGENVILLDTPGLEKRGAVFDETSKWLTRTASKIGKSGLYLDGIVLTHSIRGRPNDIVSQPFLIDQANTLMGRLEKIFDEKDVNAYQRIVLATTMWDQIENWEQIQEAEEKENEIKTHNWNIMHAARSSIMRFDNTFDAARRIVQKIVEEKKSGDAVYGLRKVMRKELDRLKSNVNRLDASMSDNAKELQELKEGISRFGASMATQKQESDELSDIDRPNAGTAVQNRELNHLESDATRLGTSMVMKQKELSDLKLNVDRLDT